jgi:hypothetical protein
MQSNCEGQWKSDKEQSAGADSCGRERFHDRPFRPKSQSGDPEDKNKEDILDSGKYPQNAPDFTMKGQPAHQLVRRGDGCQPLDVNEKQRAHRSPKPVSAMTDGFSQREIFKEGQQNDKGHADGKQRGRTPQDQADHTRNENDSRRHALPCHKEGIP